MYKRKKQVWIRKKNDFWQLWICNLRQKRKCLARELNLGTKELKNGLWTQDCTIRPKRRTPIPGGLDPKEVPKSCQFGGSKPSINFRQDQKFFEIWNLKRKNKQQSARNHSYGHQRKHWQRFDVFRRHLLRNRCLSHNSFDLVAWLTNS